MSNAIIPPQFLCYAGRQAFFGGRWPMPCHEFGRHEVRTVEDPGVTKVRLCDEHFEQVQAAGLIDFPDTRWPGTRQ